MTKFRKIILLPILALICACGFFSCGVDRWPEYASQIELDTWMYDIMQEHYLWYQQLPAYNEVNPFEAPATFLKNVVASGDSYSFADSVLDVPLPTYGFDYSLVRSSDNDTAYNALVTYVIPGSPAAEAGLKRGNWIMKVDTSYISRKYETQLLQGTEARHLILGEWKEVPVEDTAGESDTIIYAYRVVATEDTLQLAVARSVEDDPVHTYKILTVKENGNDIKVGYLMYSSFTAGTTSEPEKYNDELRQVSKEFQAAGVKYVILDLRYNAGGSMECVQLLGSILTSASRLDQPMAYLEYSDKHSERGTTLYFSSDLLKSGCNLNPTALIAITSSTTAGAPEMLLQSLYVKDSYPVVTIGSTTKGQNVATEQFVNDTHRWSINPVVCTVYTADKEEMGALSPATDLKVSETTINNTTDYSQYLPFGDENERMLKIAIGVIDGSYPPAEEETTPAQFKIEKSVSSPASRKFKGKGLRITE